jgi:hypothetical protein
MKKQFQANQTLKRFIVSFHNPRDAKVLTRVEHGKRSFWLHGGIDPLPTDAEVIGEFNEVKAFFTKES